MEQTISMIVSTNCHTLSPDTNNPAVDISNALSINVNATPEKANAILIFHKSYFKFTLNKPRRQ